MATPDFALRDASTPDDPRPGSLLYRAPQSFAYQWRLNSTDIGGASAPDYTPTGPGSYSCRVTATNRAGSAAQTSAAFTVS